MLREYDITIGKDDILKAIADAKLTDTERYDWGEATPEQIKVAVFRWLDGFVEAVLADLDWWIGREQSDFETALDYVVRQDERKAKSA